MKKRVVLFVLFVILIVGIVVLISLRKSDTDAETAECIGGNSTLYIRTGCSACRYQEELFGNNFKYLNVVDCAIGPEKCEGIYAVPTWIINDAQYRGARSINTLKELTGC